MCAVEEKTEFKFDELDNKAKAHARDKWRDGDLQHNWWEFVYEDAVTMGALIGIEIGERGYRTVGNTVHKQPDIYFSGFWSQGDGCCFNGWLHIGRMKNAVENLKLNDWSDENILELAADAERIFKQIQVERAVFSVEGSGG